MKNRIPFEWLGDRELMIVRVKINGEADVRMALDTGATRTTIDLNILLMGGVSLQDFAGRQAVETANGIVFADLYWMPEFQFAGQCSGNRFCRARRVVRLRRLPRFGCAFPIEFLH